MLSIVKCIIVWAGVLLSSMNKFKCMWNLTNPNPFRLVKFATYTVHVVDHSELYTAATLIGTYYIDLKSKSIL